MKMLVYNILQSEDENDIVLSKVMMEWNEVNEEIAKKEAYNGEYTIEDDGQEKPIPEPTQLDEIQAQVTYTAIMTDTLIY